MGEGLGLDGWVLGGPEDVVVEGAGRFETGGGVWDFDLVG